MIRTKIISYEFRIRIFWMLVAVATLSAALYVYALSMTVRNTAMRQGLEHMAAELNAKESSLEYQYISLRNNISIETAYAEGYQDISKPIYIGRAKSDSLTMNTVTSNR